jgi:crotonobetainyl-CoA:carnitine CoA-transferase CaiB-like acyl-CoA transferase
MTSGALDGIRVVEVANFIAGPLAGALLADFGADVVKIESPPTRGDPFRVWSDGLYSPHFQAYNAGKRSLAIDLRSPEARGILNHLTMQADVVIHNLRPSTAAELNLGYPELSAVNSSVILCAISAFGSEGPYTERPGFDTMGQALSGLLSLLVDPDDPRPIGPAMADQLAGMSAAYGIVAALLQRHVTGMGQQVETSLLAAGVSFVGEPLLSAMMTGEVPDRYARPSASQAFTFQCCGGDLVAIHLSSPEKFWIGFVEAVGAPHLLEDERYATRALRVVHYGELYEELGRIFKTRERAWWLARLEQLAVPCAPVHSLIDVPEDPQVKALELIQQHTDTRGHKTVSISNPVKGKVRRSSPVPAPLLGQHTIEILREAGSSDAEARDLLAKGIAAVQPDGT